MLVRYQVLFDTDRYLNFVRYLRCKSNIHIEHSMQPVETVCNRRSAGSIPEFFDTNRYIAGSIPEFFDINRYQIFIQY